MMLEEACAEYARIKELGMANTDPEEYHAAEDYYVYRVLKEVVDGNPLSISMAKMAISLMEAEYTRWYA